MATIKTGLALSFLCFMVVFAWAEEKSRPVYSRMNHHPYSHAKQKNLHGTGYWAEKPDANAALTQPFKHCHDAAFLIVNQSIYNQSILNKDDR